MKVSEFDYELNKNLIAQCPLKKRDDSKLLVLDKTSGAISHFKFYEIEKFLKAGDCLILNNSRVFKARIFGTNEKTNGKMEFFLLNYMDDENVWKVMCKPARRAKIGTIFNFNNRMNAQILKELNFGVRIIKFNCNNNELFKILDEIGQIPLPPYIKNEKINFECYQTIYAKNIGSVAAPTAGLHFTHNLLCKLQKKGVNICYITLHVGISTFKPVVVENVADHKMHDEFYFITKQSADLINLTKQNGGKIVCVGTTSCRTLESVFLKFGEIREDEGLTNLFIYPGYKFNVVDGLITNFHLPKSTLLMLVSALAGKNNIDRAYEEAKLNNYRFFSFGDAMAII